MSNAAELGVLFMTLFIILFLFYTYLQKRMKHQEPIFSYYNHCSAQLRLQTLSQRQQNEVFSISGRVQGQNPTQTLSSDAFVSIGHITASNQFNKPPTNDEPPSYEEAICLPVPDLRQTRIQVQQPPSHTVAMN
ncbi:uncharacterized protein LOC109595585 isoform X2 [Aethina tumida]|uniref:uncharacterized protein LOC109595585 isoform X2 n=1 Tax=Aethina tumida TaxID=116153 RepID=UPI00214931EE|nr:uncharacterized protein LOC109595585 isoform X2 [Aethina tumida]